MLKVSVNVSKCLNTKRTIFSELNDGDKFFLQDERSQIYVKKVIHQDGMTYHLCIAKSDIGFIQPNITLIPHHHHVDGICEPEQVRLSELCIGDVFETVGCVFMLTRLTGPTGNRYTAISLDPNILGKIHTFNSGTYVYRCSYEFNGVGGKNDRD